MPDLTFKEKIKFKCKKVKHFFTKKRQFPIVLHINLGPFRRPDILKLKSEIRTLKYEKATLYKKIKKLNMQIEILEMEVSLNKREDW